MDSDSETTEIVFNGITIQQRAGENIVDAYRRAMREKQEAVMNRPIYIEQPSGEPRSRIIGLDYTPTD